VITARSHSRTAGSTSWTGNPAPQNRMPRHGFHGQHERHSRRHLPFSAPEHASVVASFRQSFARRGLSLATISSQPPEHNQTDDKVAAAMRAPSSVNWEDKGACAATVGRFEDRLITTLAREAAK
jgi:metallo-beta-lactamase class B